MDSRFRTGGDPRFKRAPRNVRRVQVDDRFTRMFTDKSFVETSQVDARGRSIGRNSAKTKLQEFYDLAHGKNPVRDNKDESGNDESSTNGCDESDDEENSASGNVNSPHLEANEDNSEEEIDSPLGDAEVDTMQGDPSRRLAVLGCHWELITASDILMVFASFLTNSPVGGSVDRVAIYPSEYGVEKMAAENQHGPELCDKHGKPLSADVDYEATEEGNRILDNAVRGYQRQLRKYYYGVVECDSVATATWLYDELDGTRVDALGTDGLNLQFVPDGTEFSREPRTQTTEVPKCYKAPEQAHSALLHTRVQCTWDEDDPSRQKLVKRKFTEAELEEGDLDAFLASSSSEEHDPKESAEMRRLLLGDLIDAETEGAANAAQECELSDVEMTVNVEHDALEKKLTDRALRKDGNETKKAQSTWEQYIAKRKEKRREKKATAKAERAKNREIGYGEPPQTDKGDLELIAMGEPGKNRDFNFRNPNTKATRGSHADADAAHGFQFEVDDARLVNVFTNTDFDIDPTHPEFRSSTNMKEILRKKRELPRVHGASGGVGAQTEAPSRKTVSRTNDIGLQLFTVSEKDGTGKETVGLDPTGTAQLRTAPTLKSRGKRGSESVEVADTISPNVTGKKMRKKQKKHTTL